MHHDVDQCGTFALATTADSELFAVLSAEAARAASEETTARTGCSSTGFASQVRGGVGTNPRSSGKKRRRTCQSPCRGGECGLSAHPSSASRPSSSRIGNRRHGSAVHGHPKRVPGLRKDGAQREKRQEVREARSAVEGNVEVAHGAISRRLPASASSRSENSCSQAHMISEALCRAKLHGVFKNAQRQSKDGPFFLLLGLSDQLVANQLGDSECPAWSSPDLSYAMWFVVGLLIVTWWPLGFNLLCDAPTRARPSNSYRWTCVPLAYRSKNGSRCSPSTPLYL